MEPPPFQEAARCDVCKCSFNTFRRRHHCRCCGRTLCHEHSANQTALPQFGIHTNVRVCSDCFNISARSGNEDGHISSDSVDAVTNKLSSIDVGENVDIQSKPATVRAVPDVPECKCGMPLCICEAPAPAADPPPLQLQRSVASPSQSNPKPKKLIGTQQTLDHSTKNVGAASNIKQSSFFNLGQSTTNTLDKPSGDYEVSGEGLREAIKNRDTASVKMLLNKGVDANYCDKQGLSLLHLAAVFNQTEIAFILMDYGAKVDCKNAQGETPLDCAPAMLQYKMQKKLEGDA